MSKHQFKPFLPVALLGIFSAVSTPTSSQAAPAPREKLKGQLQTVAQFYGAMPTGVTVSQKGRIFVNFPRWGDNVPFTVAEIKNGRAVAYPDLALNDFGANGTRAALSQEKSARAREERETHLVGVQSVVVDAKDRLWILDTGSIQFGPTAPGGPKLVCMNLENNTVERVIPFAANVALPTSYLNDVRFDLGKGRGGTAYITDSGAGSPGGIVVVDLASGRSFRRLDNHPSVQPEPRFVPFVEGHAVFSTPKGKFPKYLGLKSDGIAISNDGSRLFYCPLASRRLYSVSTAALLSSDASAAARTVLDHGDKGMSDGLESDAEGRVYCTQPETNSISRRLPNGLFETVVHDDRLLWPDTLSLAKNGNLYVIANQLHEQKGFNYGKDKRRKPYSLFRIKTDGTPIHLK
ncbi:Sugar lactone lactonase YvrE [Abditibacterium utsteinense]|uniref:Sugar lactone lactonase YvrE n=1 Tax=Abditibacterium utsteinense TaxID=1960156 RepID=A0A2S8SQV8_9BACT|nr:L-dopachrome tautomerase-related protein [Abditibacterium utsteinense]PQV63166.1 Sugar lactone lactonase YvrE [Abditibacterium utsteinense]